MARKLRCEFAGACFRSATLRAQLREKPREAEERRSRCDLAGGDRTDIRDAISEWRKQRLRVLAHSLVINLADLPRMKSAPEKLTLTAAMEDTTSGSLGFARRTASGEEFRIPDVTPFSTVGLRGGHAGQHPAC